MARPDSFGRKLDYWNKQNDFNTRRYSKLFPYVERKLDIVNFEDAFTLEFKAPAENKVVTLSLAFKSDNCCDCEYGNQIGTMFAYATSASPPESFGYGTPVSLDFTTLDQTGYTGNITIHTSPPFTTKYWNDYPNDIPAFSLISNKLVIPRDGFYNLNFKQTVLAGSPATTVVVSIRQNGNIITKRTYTKNDGDFDSATTLQVTANCIPLYEDDIIEAYIDGDVPRTPSGYTGFTTGKLTTVYVGAGAGGLNGIIKDSVTLTPIGGATVKANIIDNPTVTANSDGFYQFNNLPPGTYPLTISATGYTTINLEPDVTIEFGKLLNLNITLESI